MSAKRLAIAAAVKGEFHLRRDLRWRQFSALARAAQPVCELS
jgi:hypothetical protein